MSLLVADCTCLSDVRTLLLLTERSAHDKGRENKYDSA